MNKGFRKNSRCQLCNVGESHTRLEHRREMRPYWSTGNPKNDANERAACMAVYLAGSAADDPDPLSDRVEHIETRIATLAAQFARLAGASHAD